MRSAFIKLARLITVPVVCAALIQGCASTDAQRPGTVYSKPNAPTVAAQEQWKKDDFTCRVQATSVLKEAQAETARRRAAQRDSWDDPTISPVSKGIATVLGVPFWGITKLDAAMDCMASVANGSQREANRACGTLDSTELKVLDSTYATCMASAGYNVYAVPTADKGKMVTTTGWYGRPEMDTFYQAPREYPGVTYSPYVDYTGSSRPVRAPTAAGYQNFYDSNRAYSYPQASPDPY